MRIYVETSVKFLSQYSKVTVPFSPSLQERSTGQSALHVSISCKQPRCTEILLLHPNIDLTVKDKNGKTPFAAALAAKDHEAGGAILTREPKAAEQVGFILNRLLNRWVPF